MLSKLSMLFNFQGPVRPPSANVCKFASQTCCLSWPVVCFRRQATLLLYHAVFRLSTPFWNFFSGPAANPVRLVPSSFRSLPSVSWNLLLAANFRRLAPLQRRLSVWQLVYNIMPFPFCQHFFLSFLSFFLPFFPPYPLFPSITPFFPIKSAILCQIISLLMATQYLYLLKNMYKFYYLPFGQPTKFIVFLLFPMDFFKLGY